MDRPKSSEFAAGAQLASLVHEEPPADEASSANVPAASRDDFDSDPDQIPGTFAQIATDPAADVSQFDDSAAGGPRGARVEHAGPLSY